MWRRVVPLLMAVAMVGCGERREETLFSINGLSYTRSQYEAECELADALTKIAIGKLPEDEKKLERLRTRNRLSTLTQAVRGMMAEESGLTAGEKETLAAVKSVERDFATKILKSDKKPITEIRERLADERLKTAFDRLIARQTRSEAILRTLGAKELEVSDEAVREMWERTKKANHEIAISNECKRVAAEDIVRRVRAGEDFAKLADELSEMPHSGEGGEIGILTAGEIDYESPETVGKILALKDGEITDVIKGDGGYNIYKMVRRLPPGSEDNPLDEEQYQIARILLRRYMTYSAEDEDDIRMELKRRGREQAGEKLWEEINRRVKLELPASLDGLGENERKLLKSFTKEVSDK